jgi:phosphoribosylanthranilate isomerase
LQIKICGITNVADGYLAATEGADAIGLNFYAKSPRHVSRSEVPAIVGELPSATVVVGVFVNPNRDEIRSALAGVERIQIIQWHGENHPTRDCLGYKVVPAFQLAASDSLTEISNYLERCRISGQLPDAVLVDARAAGLYGGTGRTVPWDLLAEFRPGVPVILAGGLTPDNVAEAIRIVRPYAVDVASGVERGPGRKDADLVRRFIESAREASLKYAVN